MTNEQREALKAVSGITLTPEQDAIIDPLLLARNDAAIAEVLSKAMPPAVVSLPVEAVFDVLFTSGDYLTLKQAQMHGNQAAAMAFAVLDDAKRLGPGKVNVHAPVTSALLDALQADGLLSQAGRDALSAAATVAAPAIDYNAVSDALNSIGGA